MKVITIIGRLTKDSEVRQGKKGSLQPFLWRLKTVTDKMKEQSTST